MKHSGRVTGRLLVDEAQVFGRVDNDNCMPSNHASPEGMSDKHPGKDMHVGNNGQDVHLPINQNPFPGAEEYASRFRMDPFSWTGRPPKKRY